MTKPQFDFNTALAQLQTGHGLTGKDGVLTPLIKQLTEAVLQTEINHYLLQKSSPNRINGYTNKTITALANLS